MSRVTPTWPMRTRRRIRLRKVLVWGALVVAAVVAGGLGFAYAWVNDSETLAAWSDRVELVHADYRDLLAVLDDRGIDGVAGTLADLRGDGGTVR